MHTHSDHHYMHTDTFYKPNKLPELIQQLVQMIDYYSIPMTITTATPHHHAQITECYRSAHHMRAIARLHASHP